MTHSNFLCLAGATMPFLLVPFQVTGMTNFSLALLITLWQIQTCNPFPLFCQTVSDGRGLLLNTKERLLYFFSIIW